MKTFMPPDANARHQPKDASPVVALRRFRQPVPIRVHMKQGRPASVSIFQRGLSGGVVDACAGPWRTSGGWWLDARKTESEAHPSTVLGVARATVEGQSPKPEAESRQFWDRDEWDVAIAEGQTYRLFRERHSDKWFLEGVVD